MKCTNVKAADTRYALILFAVFCWLQASTHAAEFFIRDGDRVAFLGDSITEQGKPDETDRGGLYTVYIEAYTLTRFPNWKVAFRNFGIGGDTAMLIQRQPEPIDRKGLATADEATREKMIEGYVAKGLAREILSWKPTLVTIDFGMNDFGYQKFNEDHYRRYIHAQKTLINTLRSHGSRIALLTPQPIEQPPQVSDSNEGAKNAALRKFADGLKGLAGEQNIPFVDQFDPYLALVRESRASSPPVHLGGGIDAVHPGAPGHTVMAWTILKTLGASSDVSSAEIDARTQRVIDENRCQISEVVRTGDDMLSFNRTDAALPMPLDERAVRILARIPMLADLNCYMLKIAGLAAGRYEVRIDDELAASVDAEELNQGWNMAMAKGPITAQAQQVMQLILKKNALVYGRWAEMMVKPDPRLNEIERQLNLARLPKPHRFSIKPVKQ